MKTIELDENLILQMAAGRKDAFIELYSITKDAVYGFALSILRSRQDAEDVMHDAYIRIYSSGAAYVPQGKPLAWILSIVRNLCYNKLRDSSRTDSLDEGSVDFEPENSVDDIEDLTDRMVLDAALKILADDEREIVIMHALTGYKHREIAEMLDMPQGTVLSKYKRAIGKLRKVMEDTNEKTGKEDA